MATEDKTQDVDPSESNEDKGRSAQPSTLDELLAEYDEKAKASSDKTETEPSGTKPGPAQAIVDRISALERAEDERSYRNAMTGVIETIRGDLDVDDYVIEGWVNRMANDDPRLAELWEQRDHRRSEFNRAVSALGERFRSQWTEKHGQPDPEANQRKAIGAAVASARTAPSSTADDLADGISGLSDHDLELRKREIFKRLKESA